MDEIAAQEGPTRPKSRAKDSEAVRDRCELLKQPIEWAAVRGSEGRTLCEWRILLFGHWRRYVVVRERERRRHPEWSKTKVRSYVLREYFGYQGLIEERNKYYQWLDMWGPFMPSEPRTAGDIIREARDAYLGRPSEEPEYHDATGALAAFDALPPAAPSDKVMSWVMSHRRVFLLRQNPPTGDEAPNTTLSARDMKDAPSQSAVNMLQEALANLKEWWKPVMSEQKKSVTATPSGPTGDEWADEQETGDDDLFA
jgi:hypothetical protein